MEDRRPTPESMLARAAVEEARAHRGRLKLFFGASPGVGKTYAMLEAAHARRKRGDDVLIGWIETHGRADTEALAKGLERVPPRVAEYRGLSLREMDLDAVLARRPALVLVDELAHENAPGSRHARRWQDVLEILDAGIDVHTTLNVQHVDSLRDVVAGITGVTVHETVPDTVLDRADEIELVDLSPEDLLQRLKEGKVYVPAQAERAMERFFTKGNLIALRELALRRTAERVDVAGREWRDDQGIARPWAARERILVALSPAPQSAELVRSAARMSARLKAPWIALSVETPAFDGLPEEDRARVASHLALAERLGGETLVVRGERIGDEILAASRSHDVTRIIIGQPGRRRLSELWKPNLVDWLVRQSAGLDVLVTRGGGGGGGTQSAARPAPPRASGVRDEAFALGIVAVATLACWATRAWLEIADQSMVYLLGILAAASRLSRRATFLAAFASVLALDYFFVPPYFTLAVEDQRYVITFGVLFVTALVVGRFAARVRRQAEAASERERRTAAVYAMSRELAGRREPDEIAAIGARHVADLLHASVVVFLPTPDGGLRAAAGGASDLSGSEKERAVARWVLENGRPAGHGTDTLPGSAGLYLPLSTSGRPHGVLGAALGARPVAPSPSDRQLLDAFVAQVAVALERSALAAQAERTQVAIETERMRSTLLSTVSHDLRTPLASITGSATAMLDLGPGIPDATRRELLTTIRDEGDRLGRLVSDLLDLTRLEGGAIVVKKDWYPLEEVVASALQRMRSRLEGRAVALDMPKEVLLAQVDAVLLEQVVVNLLDNAAKHTPEGTPVEIRLRSEPTEVALEVLDRGPGIPAGEEERIFDKFHRIETGRHVEGTGLGLAVCKAIVRAHDGRIGCTNRPGGGAAFRVTLPREDGAPVLPPHEDEEEGDRALGVPPDGPP